MVDEPRSTELGPAFHTYDLTLTDRELEDFLSFMEHQNTGCYADNVPQLPEAAADFPGLQLQPHAESPSNSEGSESIGVDPPVIGLPEFMRSAASFSTAEPGVTGSPGSNNTWNDTMLHDEQLPTSSLMEAAADLPKLEAMNIKVEPETASNSNQQVFMSPSLPPAVSMAPALAATVLVTDAPATATIAPAYAEESSAVIEAQTSPAEVPVSMSFAAAVQQPAAPGLQNMVAGTTGVPVSLGQWPGTTAGMLQGQQQQQLPQVLFVQAPNAAAVRGSYQQQQQQAQQQPQLASLAKLGRTASASVVAKQEPALYRSSGKLQRAASVTAAETTSSGGKMQISHSTVEKQRRDRLNSLIDELSDIVPPADPKYGNDASSVRRPKHVVLSDTINLLKAMQAKLQIEEAEISTLKQQAAAVAAMAAAQHQQQGMVAAAAAGNGCAAGPASVSAQGGAGMMRTDSGELGGAPVLPLVPDSVAPSTGVLVEHGVNCLFVKVNCKDRKGLLSDVVSALKAFPLVIRTAAITTTKDGTVHDVFEVKIEDETVTPEDIQCAVHMALFVSDRAHGKRLRKDSGVIYQDNMCC